MKVTRWQTREINPDGIRRLAGEALLVACAADPPRVRIPAHSLSVNALPPDRHASRWYLPFYITGPDGGGQRWCDSMLRLMGYELPEDVE